MLLRIGFDIRLTDDNEPEENDLVIRFVDAQTLKCGDRTEDFWGCADWFNEPQVVRVTIRNKSDDQLYSTILHELLHVLALMSHAKHGIMSTGDNWDGTYGLSEMDRAQLWLFSDPRFRGGSDATRLKEVKQMMRLGDWAEAPHTQGKCLTEEPFEEILRLECVPAP